MLYSGSTSGPSGLKPTAFFRRRSDQRGLRCLLQAGSWVSADRQPVDSLLSARNER